jgi:hypothetical protein
MCGEISGNFFLDVHFTKQPQKEVPGEFPSAEKKVDDCALSRPVRRSCL